MHQFWFRIEKSTFPPANSLIRRCKVIHILFPFTYFLFILSWKRFTQHLKSFTIITVVITGFRYWCREQPTHQFWACFGLLGVSSNGKAIKTLQCRSYRAVTGKEAVPREDRRFYPSVEFSFYSFWQYASMVSSALQFTIK